MTPEAAESKPSHFLRQIVRDDLQTGRRQSVVTRFPPEPNGYLHIGHAKSICLQFSLAQEFGGRTNLRFDDTNPTTEDVEFVQSIQHDVRWLGFEWDELHHASDYFDHFHTFALNLIKAGKAYVDSLSEDDIRAYRGTVTEAGRPSPYRDRSVEENLDLFQRMKAGEFPDGAHVLRAKIDMAHPNMKMRDPLLYRIRHAHHYRTGEVWRIYPMYDFAHCLSDALEGVTHSICTLEFENNRDIYDWVLDETEGVPFRSRQYEFARLFLNYTVMSKRKLLTLVQDNHVDGWDDPRMPTIAGMRRRGYTPEAIRDFCDRIGVAKANSLVDIEQLEFSVRDDLNHRAPRVMCVLRPLKVIVTTYEGSESLRAPSFPPEIGKEGERTFPFTRELYIDADDFSENPPAGWHRLKPGGEVRLRYAYVIQCERVEKDTNGDVVALHCSHDPATLGAAPVGRKVKGAIHWVSAEGALDCEVRLYDRLFSHPRPDGDKDVSFLTHLNPNSLETVQAKIEPGVQDSDERHYQFERQGFFYRDDEAEGLTFNRTVTLRDSWNKQDAPKQTTPTSKTKTHSKVKTKTDAELTEGFSDAQRTRWQTYVTELKMNKEDAALIVGDVDVSAFVEAALATHRSKTVTNLAVNELMRILKEQSLADLNFDGAALGHLGKLIDDGKISSKIAKDVFAEMVANGGDPREIVKAKGLEQVDDSAALAAMIDEILAKHPDEVARFRAGETKLTGFFVGQIMKASGGKANPKTANQVLRQKLAG